MGSVGDINNFTLCIEKAAIFLIKNSTSYGGDTDSSGVIFLYMCIMLIIHFVQLFIYKYIVIIVT